MVMGGGGAGDAIVVRFSERDEGKEGWGCIATCKNKRHNILGGDLQREG